MADAKASLTLRDLVKQSYENSAAHGFWDNERTVETIPSKLALIHSEVSEALEAYRDPESVNLIKVPASVVKALLSSVSILGDGEGEYEHPVEAWLQLTQLYDKWEAKPKGFAQEIADIAIRVGDLAGAEGIDLDKEVRDKHEFNKGRPRMHGRLV